MAVPGRLVGIWPGGAIVGPLKFYPGPGAPGRPVRAVGVLSGTDKAGKLVR